MVFWVRPLEALLSFYYKNHLRAPFPSPSPNVDKELWYWRSYRHIFTLSSSFNADAETDLIGNQVSAATDPIIT